MRHNTSESERCVGNMQRLREKLQEDSRVRMSADETVLNLPTDEEVEEKDHVKTISGVANNMEEDWELRKCITDPESSETRIKENKLHLR